MNVNKDLQRERERCTFNPMELTYLLDGGTKKTKERRDRGKPQIFLSFPREKCIFSEPCSLEYHCVRVISNGVMIFTMQHRDRKGYTDFSLKVLNWCKYFVNIN